MRPVVGRADADAFRGQLPRRLLLPDHREPRCPARLAGVYGLPAGGQGSPHDRLTALEPKAQAGLGRQPFIHPAPSPIRPVRRPDRLRAFPGLDGPRNAGWVRHPVSDQHRLVLAVSNAVSTSTCLTKPPDESAHEQVPPASPAPLMMMNKFSLNRCICDLDMIECSQTLLPRLLPNGRWCMAQDPFPARGPDGEEPDGSGPRPAGGTGPGAAGAGAAGAGAAGGGGRRGARAPPHARPPPPPAPGGAGPPPGAPGAPPRPPPGAP